MRSSRGYKSMIFRWLVRRGVRLRYAICASTRRMARRMRLREMVRANRLNQEKVGEKDDDDDDDGAMEM